MIAAVVAWSSPAFSAAACTWSAETKSIPRRRLAEDRITVPSWDTMSPIPTPRIAIETANPASRSLGLTVASRINTATTVVVSPAQMTGLLGASYSVNRASYDLTRLRRNGLITRIQGRNRYRLTAGLPSPRPADPGVVYHASAHERARLRAPFWSAGAVTVGGIGPNPLWTVGCVPPGPPSRIASCGPE